jgi:hypothetical protein
MKSKFNLIFLVVLLYGYIYNPIFNIIGIGSAKILLIIAIIYSFFNNKIFKSLVYFKTELIFVFILVIYSFLSALRSEVGLFAQVYLYLVWFIESIYLPIVIFVVFKKVIDKYQWDKLLITVGVIAAVITILLIFNPSLNGFVRYRLIQTSAEELDGYALVRDFGLADGLRGSYPMTQGLILGLCLFALKRSVWYALLILPLVISIAFNARTGLFAIPVSLILLLVHFKFNFRVILVLASLLLLILNFTLIFDSFIAKNEETFYWLSKGYEEVIANLMGDRTGVAYETLLVDEKFMPYNSISLLIGTGNFGPSVGRVDNGYYYYLWFGGWIFISIIFLFLLYTFIRINRIEKEKYYPYLFFFLLLIYTVKSNYLFNPSGMSRLIGFYYVYRILSYKTSINEENNFILATAK